MRWRTPFLAVAAALLAFAAWRDAAVAYWLDTGPDEAPWPLQSDSRIARAVADAGTLDEAGQDEAFERKVPGLARAVLRDDPLDAAAMRQLGQLALAERISRRDAATQAILLRQAAASNDYRGTFMHLDTVLATDPSAGQRFFAPMATLLADPQVRSALAGYGHRAWFGTFAAAAVTETGNPADLVALLLANRAPASEAAVSALPRLLTRLLDEDEYPAARDLALRFGKAEPRALDDFAMSPASVDPRFAPLSWRLADSEAVQAGLTPEGALEVRLRPGVVAAFAERVTALAPGGYAIEQSATRGEGDGTLLVAWELRCRRGDRVERVWRQPLPMQAEGGHHRAQLEVPADCPLQHWRLTALADDTQSDSTFTIAGLRIAAS